MLHENLNPTDLPSEKGGVGATSVVGNQFAARLKPLRILMFTWEYPPRIIGGIARVVEGLSKALVKQGAEVHVITNEMPGSPAEQNDDGVFVHRVEISSPAPNFHSWVLLMNHYFAKRAGLLGREVGHFDIVHAHDWLVLPSTAESKNFFGCTMISTLHSLEYKRAGGVTSPEGRMIESFEWWLTYESSLVIVCSNAMKSDTKWKYKVPDQKIWVVPIGLDASKFLSAHPNKDQVRERFGISRSDKLVLFVGRLTHQKGCEYLIRSIPSLAKYYNAKLVIVGDGYMRGELEYVAQTTGEGWRVRFTGFIPDTEVVDLMMSADVMVIPSVYEPFGVVALEAMAARVPIVASNVDGLAEIVKHEYNGILAYPKDPASISWGISRILSDPENTQRLVENGTKELSKQYTWDAVAALTLECYKKAFLE
ncbi:MAG: glycosyltransferase family 4 protein [archaeon]|nr:glycosyltransferase family 4 protein [archaeon]